jgi:hypothetical protein
MKPNRASALIHLLLSTVLAGTVGASTSGCASEQKVLRAPHYTLTHPDYWKVESVAKQDGEPTLVKIGRFSSTVMNEGVGADESTPYESSEAEVEVRVYTWKDQGNDPPAMAVVNKLADDTTLNLTKHGRVTADRGECGKDFQRKYNVLGTDHEPLDLVMQPGFRTIVLGGKASSGDGPILMGVVARVPYEQDPGLYCHNLTNLQLRLGKLLEGMKPDASAPTAAKSPDPAPAAPAQP